MTESHISIGVDGGNVYMVSESTEPQIMSSSAARELAKHLCNAANVANESLPNIESENPKIPWKALVYNIGVIFIFISSL
jgi:hypothetical protein